MSQRWLSLDDARVRASDVTPTEFVTWHPSWILLAGEIRTGALMSGAKGTMKLVGDYSVMDDEKQHPTRGRYCLLRREGEAQFAGWLEIGRTIDNDIVINDYTISKQHARIRRNPRGVGWILEDRGSTNHSFVEREPLKKGKKVLVKSGTLVRFGRLHFTLLEPSDFCELLMSGEGGPD
jgi:hypothetical protein